MATPQPGLVATLAFSNLKMRQVDFPIAGCARIDSPGGPMALLGESIQLEPIRTLFTDVSMTLLEAEPNGRSVIQLKGSNETLRIVERI